MSDPRATGGLYTGLHSQSFGKQKQERRKRLATKQEQQAQLEPYEEIVLTEIVKLKTEIALELGNLIHVDTDKEDVKSIVIGLNLATRKMTSLEARLKNVMRGRKAVESEGDDDAEL